MTTGIFISIIAQAHDEGIINQLASAKRQRRIERQGSPSFFVAISFHFLPSNQKVNN